MRAKWSMLFGPEGAIILWPKGSILFGQRGQICLAFPDGHNHAEVAKCVAKMLVKKYGRKIGKVVFSCVPASSQERNEVRKSISPNLYAGYRVPLMVFHM